jgi:hypothetical protein
MTALASLVVAASFPHIAARILYLQWQYGVQPLACIVLGLAVARHTRGGYVPWLVAGFLAGAIPIAGYLIMAGAWFWYPRAEQRTAAVAPADVQQPAGVAGPADMEQPAGLDGSAHTEEPAGVEAAPPESGPHS